MTRAGGHTFLDVSVRFYEILDVLRLKLFSAECVSQQNHLVE